MTIFYCYQAPTGTRKAAFQLPFLYPRAESNRNRQNRTLKFYPLNYGGRM